MNWCDKNIRIVKYIFFIIVGASLIAYSHLLAIHIVNPQPILNGPIIHGNKTEIYPVYLAALKATNNKAAAELLQSEITTWEQNKDFCAPLFHGVEISDDFYNTHPFIWAYDLQRRAEQGESRAQYDLGLAYRYAIGVKEDDAEAIKWFLKVADGNPPAAGHLGEVYAFSKDVKPDFEKAYYYLSLASVQGIQWTKDWCKMAELQLPSERASEVQRKIKDWVHHLLH